MIRIFSLGILALFGTGFWLMALYIFWCVIINDLEQDKHIEFRESE